MVGGGTPGRLRGARPRAPSGVLVAVAAVAATTAAVYPLKLVAKVASDAEKPRGFVVLTREQACERFAGAACGLVPGIGPKTAERLRTLGVVAY